MLQTETKEDIYNFVTAGKPILFEDNQALNYTAGRKPLSISTLGRFDIRLDGRQLDTSDFLKRRRIQDLLILLILNRNDGLRKEKIFDLFWKNYTERSRKDNLNTLIYRLKKLLNNDSNLLIIDRNTIRLDMDMTDIDIDLFTVGVETVKNLEDSLNPDEALAKARETASLYRGEFLENISTDVSVEREKTGLKKMYTSLLFRMLRLSAAKGFYREALETGKELIDIDPLCEPAYRLLMTTLGHLGNTSEITRLYAVLEKRLKDNFEILPDEKTMTLKNKLILGVLPDTSEVMNEVSVFL